MFYQVLLTVLGLCVAFEIKCPEPAQWSLRARLHCPNPSLYYCLLSIDGNTRINVENCSNVDIEAPGRRIVIRWNIDSLPCSDDKYQPIKYWTNVSSDCLFLTSKCTEEGQVLYSIDHYHEYDITCICDHTRGYDFVTRPKNKCFCIPSQEDCSCYKKTCSTVNSEETQKSVVEVCTVPNITSDFMSKVVLTLLPKINQTDQGNTGNSAKTPTLVAVLLVTIIFSCSCVVYLRCRKEYFVKTLDPKTCIEGDECLLQCQVLYDSMEASWFKGDIAIKPSTDKYEVNHNGKQHSLKLLNLNLEDTGEYSIKIKNCSRRAQLTVQELPKTVKAMSTEDIKQFMELTKSEKMERRSFFRTVIVGQEGGGKTYLKRRLLKEQIEDIEKNMHSSTVGVDVDVHNIRIPIADDDDWIFDEDKKIETGYRIAEALDKSVVEGKNTEEENITAKLDKSMTQNNTSSPEHLNSSPNKKDIDKLTTIDERQNKVSNEAKHHQDYLESTKHYGKAHGTLENNKTEKQIKMDGQPHIENTSMKEIKQVPKENEKNTDKMKYPIEANYQNIKPKTDGELRMSEINLPLQLSKYAFSKLWDFAGQKIYYATHQAFLTSAAIYLLVVNLQDCSKEKKKNCDEKEDNFIDIEDYIDFWLDTIYCYSSLDTTGQNLSDKDGTPAELPGVLIICTHTDKYEKDELEALKKELDTKISAICEKKAKATHMDRNIIYISNTQGEDKVFKEIRGRIAKLAQQAKENIPLTWILLEMEIDKLGDKKCISVDEIYKLGDSVQMSDKNKVKLFLKYQHKIGNIIFFDEKDLNENVILQPSWLIEVSKCVICHGLSGLQGEHFTNLKDKGIITKKKLEELLKAKYGSDDIYHATQVLQKFDILIPFNDSFCVPCMIRGGKKKIETIKTEIMQNESCWETTSWFCLTFDFLPPSFFHHILSCFTKNKMFKDGIKNLYCGTCVFKMRSTQSPQKLAVCVSKSKIAMQGWVCTDKQDFTPGLYSYVRNQLENFVSCIKKRYALNIRYDVTCIPKSYSFMSEGSLLKNLFENHFKNEKVNYGEKNFEASTLFREWFTSWLTIEDNSLQKTKKICLKHNDEWRWKFKKFLQEVELVNISNFDAVCTCSDVHNEVWKTVSTEQMALAHFEYKEYFCSKKDQTVLKHQKFYSTLLENDMFFYDTKCSADRLVCVMFSEVIFGEIEENIPKAKLAIDLPEYFQRTPKDKTQCLEGTDVELTFVVVDHNFDAQWENDGKVISQSSKYEIKHEGKTHTLIIRNCTLEDSGNYSLEVNYREMSTSLHVKDVVLPGIVDSVEFISLLKQGGTYKSYGNRIYLAGACSVGKSTLASLLIGDEIPLEWKSTDGLQIFFGRNGIHLEERKMVPLDKDEENQNILANVLRGQPGMDKSQQDINLQQQAISVSTGLESTKEAAAAQLMSGVPSKQQIMTERKTQQEEKPMQKFDIFEFTSIHDDIKKALRSGKYKVKIAPSDIVDFGGQKSYDMTHQLFIQGKGTFTLIFDGRKELQDRLAEYPQGEVTTASILRHWVDSILTYWGEDDDDILPVILFVATYRDKLKEDEQSKRMTDFKQGLTKMFQNHEHKTRIKYDNIFFINSRDRNDPEVIRLQTTYVNIAFQQKSWGKPMPMAWVPLELQMSKMRSRNISIISKNDLIKVNEQNDDLALTTRQLDEFLRVQHSLGKILYFEGQGLADYVIVQPTNLVDILRSFITDEMFWPKDETLKGILKAMTETGKIKKEDLFQIWSQEEFNQHMPDTDFKVFVAQTLTYLDLLVEPKLSNTDVSDFYLVPCMVKRQIAANFDENIDKDKMICLSYLLKSTVPSALSFKLIGAALNVWPLKGTGDGVGLYHQAAILSIDKSNELHILVRNDRVVVYLLNEQSKYFISPDIASCAQECLTLALKTALEFYHKSFGKKVSKSNLFEIEVGEKCVKDICYISLSEAQDKKSWTCKFGKEHKTKTPLYWTFDKEQDIDKCPPDCTGIEALATNPSEQHLVRLAGQIGFETCKQFVLFLGLPNIQWERIVQFEGDGTMINFKALCKWKEMVESKLKKPTFKMLQEALNKTEQDSHLLCKIFRERTLLLEMRHEILLQTPDEATLKELSQTISNCALHLGVELGLATKKIEETKVRYNKDIFEQNYDILIKWRNSGRNTTLRRLMTVLQIVDPRGLTYLVEKYKIVGD